MTITGIGAQTLIQAAVEAACAAGSWRSTA